MDWCGRARRAQDAPFGTDYIGKSNVIPRLSEELSSVWMIHRIQVKNFEALGARVF